MRNYRLLAIAAAVGSVLATQAESAPDTIFFNGTVLTVDAANTKAQAVAVTGNKISAVGSNQAILRQAGPKTSKIDLGGRTLIPGIVDAHTHIRGYIEGMGLADISAANSIGEAMIIIKAAADKAPAGAWIETAMGWQPTNFLEDRMPTRQDIDAVVPDHPVFIKKGWNAGVVNTLALTRIGVDPSGAGAGRQYVKAADGSLTGEIRGSIEAVSAKLAPRSPAEIRQAFADAMHMFNSYGITTMREAANAPADIKMYEEFADARKLTLRINALGLLSTYAPLSADLRDWKDMALRHGPWFTFDTMKIIGDGGISDALLEDDYAWSEHGAHYKGDFVTRMDKIVASAGWACDTGRKLAVHVIGDGMLDRLLTFYEDLNKRCPIGMRGWAIEHAALATPQEIDRIKALGLRVTTQTGLDYNLAAAWKKYWGLERLNRSIPNRWLIDKGIHPGGGTDADTGPINELLAMGTDVTRETRAGVFAKAQAVTPLESLRMHTIWAADIMGNGKTIGSIETGKLADLAVLDADPLSIDPEKIKDIKVTMTMVDGRIVFER